MTVRTELSEMLHRAVEAAHLLAPTNVSITTISLGAMEVGMMIALEDPAAARQLLDEIMGDEREFPERVVALVLRGEPVFPGGDG